MARMPRVAVLKAVPGRSLFSIGRGVRPVVDTLLTGDALERAVAATPEVVVIDARGAVTSGIAGLIAAVRARLPATPMVAVGDAGSEAAAAAAIASGVNAYLSRELNDSTLLLAVRNAAKGKLHLTRTGRRVVARLGPRGKPA